MDPISIGILICGTTLVGALIASPKSSSSDNGFSSGGDHPRGSFMGSGKKKDRSGPGDHPRGNLW